MSFREVDDELWRRIRYYMPRQKPKTGRPRADLRKTFNGILYVLYTGCRWVEVPKKYGAFENLQVFRCPKHSVFEG
jgi:putative transposase